MSEKTDAKFLTAEYYPAAPGFKWTYKTTEGEESELTPAEVLPYEFIGETGTLPITDVFEPSKTNYDNIKASADGVVYYGCSLGLKGSFDFIPALTAVSFPASAGARFDSETKASPHFGSTELEAGFSIVVEKIETVEVPAGKFEDCFLIVEHFRIGSVMFTTRSWRAKGVGAVKAETVTEKGFLKTLELVCAELGDVKVGDTTLACHFDFYDLRRSKNSLEKRSEPFTLAEIINFIHPLNVDYQQIAGYLLKEIMVRGATQLIFAQKDNDAAPQLRVRLFRDPEEARNLHGQRTMCNDVLLLLPPGENQTQDDAARSRKLLRQLAALIRYNQAKSKKE